MLLTETTTHSETMFVYVIITGNIETDLIATAIMMLSGTAAHSKTKFVYRIITGNIETDFTLTAPASMVLLSDYYSFQLYFI